MTLNCAHDLLMLGLTGSTNSRESTSCDVNAALYSDVDVSEQWATAVRPQRTT